MKLLTSLATIILIGLFTSLMVAANSVSPERITVIINGETLEFANPPFVENAEILVPIRPIVDFFGVDLQWDSQARVATIVNGSITITIAADSYEILWQCSYTGREEIFEMPVPARIHNNALFMPAHDIVAVLDYTINYVEDFATSFRWGRVDGEAVSSYQSTLWLAESGFAHSQFRVAVMYAHGWEGAPRDFERAAYWYRKAAESGIPQAQNNLGMLYRHGNGVPQNYETAVYWYKKAVEQGEPNAEFNLGFAYLMGLGVEADPAQSAYWNRRAAEQGQDRAQAQMGFLYMTGNGVEQDFERAVYWSRIAAEQGINYAENNLGYLYLRGLGVEQDYAQAVYWLTRAALQGNTMAQSNLTDIGESFLPMPVRGEISDYGRQVAEEFLRGFTSIFSDDYDITDRDAPYIFWGIAASDFELFDLTGDGIPEIFILWPNNEIWFTDGTYSIEDRWSVFVYVDGEFTDAMIGFSSLNFYYDRGEILSISPGESDGEQGIFYSHIDLSMASGRGAFRGTLFLTSPPDWGHRFPIPPLSDLKYEITESIIKRNQ